MTPLAATAIAAGTSTPTAVADTCFGLAHGTVNQPDKSVAVGSTVHASAVVSAMLLGAHLQIVGPGLNQQLGSSAINGVIGDDIKVEQVGDYTLSVVGNVTKCTYDTKGFTVTTRATSPKPSHSSAPHKSHLPASGGVTRRHQPPSNPYRGLTPGGGSAYAPPSAGGNSQFSLPAVAPDGSSTGFQPPTPDPQVAAPPARPLAHDVSETPPVNWGQSIALALVLLMLSAHLGMWSRRQRLATAGPGTRRRAKTARRKSAEQPYADVAETSAPTAPTPLGEATPYDPATGRPATGARASQGTSSRHSTARTYQGRRRRD